MSKAAVWTKTQSLVLLQHVIMVKNTWNELLETTLCQESRILGKTNVLSRCIVCLDKIQAAITKGEETPSFTDWYILPSNLRRSSSCNSFSLNWKKMIVEITTFTKTATCNSNLYIFINLFRVVVKDITKERNLTCYHARNADLTTIFSLKVYKKGDISRKRAKSLCSFQAAK